MAVTYAMYAMNFLEISEDSKGLYVDVPGYASDWFRVRVDESGIVPVATHCRCSHHQHKGTCAHTEIVNAFYARIYKTNIVKAQEKQVKQAILEAEEVLSTGEVAIAEQISTTESVRHFESKTSAPQIVAPKIIKLDYRSAYTASFLSNLPSRRVA
ncbi:MAG TPA: hypothetical protein VF974_00720 [Patescibacteria group bacterium]